MQQGHEFKVIVTNKITGAGKVARFHEGRGYQEKIYGELKNQAQMGYVPARRLVANKVYLLCTLLAHNLSRELQMQAEAPVRGTTEKRTVKWLFEGLDTLRRTIIARAGRLTRPQGQSYRPGRASAPSRGVNYETLGIIRVLQPGSTWPCMVAMG